MIFLYLMVAAWIDYKTKQVYRIGSIAFIVFSAGLFMITVNFKCSTAAAAEKISSILFCSFLVIVQGKCSVMGWGDVLTYIGVFFWLGSWDYECMTVELLAAYGMIANILFLICNIRKFEWKKGRMKEETAYLPAMAGAAVIIKILVLIN